MNPSNGAGLRIGLFGNICNNLYQIGKALRRHTGFDVHLFVDSGSDVQQLPESDDPELRDGYPEWIHKERYLTPTAVLAPWRSRIVRELRSCDFVIVSGFGPIFAQFSGRPWGFFVTGGDLTVYSFPWEFRFLYSSLFWKVGSWPIGWWQRRGICRAPEIWTQPYSPYLRALKRLGVSGNRVSNTYFPLVFDTARFTERPHARACADPWVQEIVRAGDFVVFHPSRLMMRDHPSLRATGQWKRNGVLIEGFARFVRRCPSQRPVLALIDREASPDVQRAKALIEALGVAAHVVWLRPPRSIGFTRDELLTLYSAADVVADDFGIGWFGGVALEALAVGRPVLTYIDDAVMSQLYPSHPMLSAGTADAVAATLMRLAESESWRRAVGAEGRRWLETFHSEAAAGAVYAARIADIVARSVVPTA